MDKSDRSHPIYRMSKEEVLIALLRKQHAYYTGVLELTDAENHVLSREGPLPEVTQLMKKKRILLECVQEIDTALSPLKRYWKEEASRSSPQAAAVQQQIDGLDKLLQEILRVDQENQNYFQQRLLALKEKMEVK